MIPYSSIIEHFCDTMAEYVCVTAMLITLASSFGSLFLGMMDTSLRMNDAMQLESQLLIFMMIVLTSIYRRVSWISKIMLCSNVMIISLHINSWMHANFTPLKITLDEPDIIPWK